LPDGTGTRTGVDGTVEVIPEATMREIFGSAFVDAIKEPTKHWPTGGKLVVTAVDRKRGAITVDVK
jgi:hypothetical protein